MEHLSKENARKLLEEIKANKPELLATAQKFMSSLNKGDMGLVKSIDTDIKFTKGPFKGQRRRASYFDRCDVSNSIGDNPVTIVTRGANGEDGAAYLLNDKQGNPRLGMMLSPDGCPSIQFTDANDRTRLTLGLGNKGDPFILFYDAKGRESFGLSEKWIRWGTPGKPEMQVEMTRKGADPMLIVGGCIHIGMVDGQPAIVMWDKSRTMEVGITATKRHGEVSIMRKQKPLWRAIVPEKKKAQKRTSQRVKE